MPHIWTISRKKHPCERSLLDINEKENIKDIFIIFHSKKFTGTIRDFLHRFEIGNVDIFSSF